ncbi:hexose kinase [bacterium]|nr:hexose kinase [bacterium]
MVITVTLNPALDLSMDVPDWGTSDVHRARRVQKTAGGKGINVARVLRELEEPATAVTILGSDSVQEFRRLSREAAVPIIYINIPGEVRTNISIIDPQNGRILKVNQPGTPVLPTYFDHFILLYKQQLKSASFVCLGGSLPPGLAPDSWARLAGLARKQDVPVLVDSTGEGLLAAIGEGVSVAKPNRRELQETLGRSITTVAEMREGAEELRAQGAEAVFISNGGENALALSDEGAFLIHTPPVTVKGTTGAGDSSAAGLVRGMTQGMPFSEASRLAVACGSASCMTPETQLLRRRDVMQLLAKVRAEKLSG